MQILRNVVYGTEAPDSQVLDMYLPDGEVNDLFIYFHGGGLENGDKGKEAPPAYLFPIADRYGKAVITANYRMYPTAVFPEFLLDAAKVVAWAKEHIYEYKDIKRIFVGGSSAGGWLAAMLAYAPEYLGAYGIKTTDIDGYVLDAPQTTTHFNILRERGMHTQRIIVDEAAPVYYIHEETAFPKALLIVSDNDMPCRYEQALVFLKTLEIFGCPKELITFKVMEGYKHCGYLHNSGVFPKLVAEFMDGAETNDREL